MNDNKRKNEHSVIVKNSLLNSIKTASSIIFPLITIPYITRILGADNLGKYNFASSVVSYFTLISSLGISTYAVKACSCVKFDQRKLNRVASELFSINICTMIIAYLMLFTILAVYPKFFAYKNLILILSINILLPIIGMDWINIAMEDFRYITIRTIAFQILSLLMMLIFIKSSDDYLKYAIITVGAGSGANIFNAFYIRKFCKIKFTRVFNIKNHIRPILLMFSLLIAQNILSNLDITMLGILGTDFEVGLYSMSVKIYLTIEKVISSIAIVLLPQMSMLFQEADFDNINKLLKNVWIFIFTLSVPFVVGLIFLSTEILGWICGEEYILASASLSILAVSMFINLLGGSFWGNIILLPSNKEGQFMFACLISALCNTVLNCYFIPIYGINGAAITTTISASVIFFICRVKKDERIQLHFTWRELLGPFIGGILIGLICCSIKSIISGCFLRIAFSVVCSAVLYFIVLTLFKNPMVLFLKSKIKEIPLRTELKK